MDVIPRVAFRDSGVPAENTGTSDDDLSMLNSDWKSSSIVLALS